MIIIDLTYFNQIKNIFINLNEIFNSKKYAEEFEKGIISINFGTIISLEMFLFYFNLVWNSIYSSVETKIFIHYHILL